jgi:hypothetical protein
MEPPVRRDADFVESRLASVREAAKLELGMV